MQLAKKAAIYTGLVLLSAATIFGQAKAKGDAKAAGNSPFKSLKDNALVEGINTTAKVQSNKKEEAQGGMKTVNVNGFATMTVPANYNVSYTYVPDKGAGMAKVSADITGLQPKDAIIRVQMGTAEGSVAGGMSTISANYLDATKTYNLFEGGKFVYTSVSKTDTCGFSTSYPDTRYLVTTGYYVQNVTGDPAAAMSDYVQSQTGRRISNTNIAAPPGIVTKYVFVSLEYMNARMEPVNFPFKPIIAAEGFRDSDAYPTANINSDIAVASPIAIRDFVDQNNYNFTQRLFNFGSWVPTSDGSLMYQLPGVEIQTVTAVEDKKALPTKFELYQNYPNPFNPSTNISFSLPHGANVTLKIFDVLGREVATLENNWLSAGTHNVVWVPREGSASGFYIYMLKAEDIVQIKKMLLLK